MAALIDPNNAAPMLLPVNGHRVAVWRFGRRGGWPVVWNHGGLICGLDAKVIDDVGGRRGADIISIDRPGIGCSDIWSMSSIAQWAQTVERIAQLLDLDEFAVTGWSGGGPYALACAAAMPLSPNGKPRVSGRISDRKRLRPNRFPNHVPRVRNSWLSCPPIDTLGTIGTPSRSANER